MAFTATDVPDEVMKMKATQRLYMLLPNHKCPQKDCPFHPPGENTQEEEEPATETLTQLREIGASVQEGGLMSMMMMAPPPPQPPPAPPKEAEDDGVSKDDFSELTVDTGEESMASDYESTLTLDSGFGRERDELSDAGEVLLFPELAHIREDDDEVLGLTLTAPADDPGPLMKEEDATEHDADDERVTPVLFAHPESVNPVPSVLTVLFA